KGVGREGRPPMARPRPEAPRGARRSSTTLPPPPRPGPWTAKTSDDPWEQSWPTSNRRISSDLQVPRGGNGKDLSFEEIYFRKGVRVSPPARGRQVYLCGIHGRRGGD